MASYVPDISAALEVLMDDPRIREAINAIKEGRVSEGIEKLARAGLSTDAIAYIVAHICDMDVNEALNIVGSKSVGTRRPIIEGVYIWYLPDRRVSISLPYSYDTIDLERLAYQKEPYPFRYLTRSALAG
ncbi:MAG: hypothetical protein GXO32_02370 [Crenarchaeota archaeon]|nr:hypothetical protein [Thermoproteota archaeon]